MRGRPLRLAVLGWLISLAVGLGAAGVMVLSHAALHALLIGLAVTTTAIGTLLPMLRDNGQVDTRWGSYMLAAGAVGEFLPIVAIAVLLTSDNPAGTVVLLIAFVALVVLAATIALRPRPPRVVEMLRRTVESSAQLPVRIVVLLVILLVWIASDLGLDILLGAFSAGIIFRLLNTGEEAAVVSTKLEAVGFGFLIPIFFVVSGMDFDLDALVDNPSTVLRLPLFLALLPHRARPARAASLPPRPGVARSVRARVLLGNRVAARRRDHADRARHETHAARECGRARRGGDSLGDHLPVNRVRAPRIGRRGSWSG